MVNGDGPPPPPAPSLPDPSPTARGLAFGVLAAAIVLAIVADKAGWDRVAFDPAKQTTADLAVFAGFFMGAQIIERVLELLAPFFPFWSPSSTTVEQKKADRGFFMLPLAALLGVVVSFALGLYLGNAIGMELSRSADILITGLALSGGTKGLHELIKALQKAKGTGSTAG